MRRWSCIFIFLISSGCQSNLVRNFDKITPGLEKTDVIALMGSPQRRQRWHGLDRWTYVYYDDLNRIEKEVHFQEGKTVYTGAPVQPKISAEEQDKIFAAENAELEKKWANQREQNKDAFKNFENDVRGDDDVREVPDYEPIK